jgi:diaminopimelate decarboxylase
VKPMGPIPPEFAGQQVLTIAGRDAEHWIAQAGDTPLFVYDTGIVEARIARLRAAMPQRLRLHYAIKANPHRHMLAAVAPLLDGLDVASGGELEKALAVKAADVVSFAGPGKRDDELELAIARGATLNVESEGEAERALAIGERLGKTPRMAIRVNPDFDLKGSGMKMGGRASPFGIDAARVPALVRRLLAAEAEWRGFHIYAGSQALNPQAIIETQAATVALARRLSEEAGAAARHVNLGGGFGIPYFAGDVAVDVEAVGRALGETLERDGDPTCEYAIELGRWLVGECGVYLTRVIDVKESQGERFVVVDGGLHHQLAASGNFGTVVRRNYPIAIAGRMAGKEAVEQSVVGSLCTPLDRLGDKVALPPARVGDVIAIFLAGAYGFTASPGLFLGHPLARELCVRGAAER